MKKKTTCLRVGYSTVLWGVLTFILCAAPPVLAQDVYVLDGEVLDIDYAEPGTVYVQSGGTLNLLPGGSIGGNLNAENGSTVNISAGTVSGTAVGVGATANVTVYGVEFWVDDPFDTLPAAQMYAGEQVILPAPYYYVLLTVTYENATTATLPMVGVSGSTVQLAEPGGQQENTPPVADAGPDLTVFTKDIAGTVIAGTATDADEGDTLQYRWVEGEVAFTLWAPVGANGEAPLNLGDMDPQYLEVGTHTLTLEVFDGTATSSDDMVLTIEIAAISIDIKPGSYPNSINLGSNGVVPVAILSAADFDATLLPAENVFLAGSGVAVRGKGNKYLASNEDVNGDGYVDLVLKVETENLDPGTFQDGMAVLRVHETSDQASPILYEGWDQITIVPPE
jgi:hypothetical protein